MKQLAYGLFILLLFTGCIPEQPTYIDELDLVYTNYTPDFNFFEKQTYAVPDSVVRYTGNLGEGDAPEMVKPIYGDALIQKIKDNMNNFGWIEVGIGEDPDMVLLPIAFSSTTVNYYYPWYNWGWYYPGGGYGWYYPGYYPPAVTSYSTGTLLVQMIHPDGQEDGESIPVHWVMVIDGLFEGSASSIVNRIERNTDQGFKQSPYLNKQ